MRIPSNNLMTNVYTSQLRFWWQPPAMTTTAGLVVAHVLGRPINLLCSRHGCLVVTFVTLLFSGARHQAIRETELRCMEDKRALQCECHDHDLLRPSSTHSRVLSTITEPTRSIPKPHTHSRLRTPDPDHARSLLTRSLVPISR